MVKDGLIADWVHQNPRTACLYFVGLCYGLGLYFLNSQSGAVLNFELAAVKLDLKKVNSCQDLRGH